MIHCKLLMDTFDAWIVETWDRAYNKLFIQKIKKQLKILYSEVKKEIVKQIVVKK